MTHKNKLLRGIVSLAIALNSSVFGLWIPVAYADPHYTWIGVTSGNFYDASNWDLNDIPSPGSSVDIPANTDYSIIIDGVVTTDSTLTIAPDATLSVVSGGTFTVTTITNNGAVTVEGGGEIDVTQFGTTGSLSIWNGGVFTIETSGTNEGTIVIETGGTFTNNGSFENQGSFTLEGTFTNNGTFTPTSGTFTNEGNFENNGEIFCPGPSLWTGSACEIQTRAWSGAYDTDWSDPANWYGDIVPLAGENALLDSGMPNYPIISSTEAVNDLTIAVGGSVTIANGGSFTLNGTFTNETELTVAAGGTYIVNGTMSVLAGGTFIMEEGSIFTNNGTVLLDGGTIACPTNYGWNGSDCGNFAWTGANSTDWTDNANWAGQLAPADGALSIVIPTTANNPIIDGVTASYGAITVNSDASLQLQNSSITITSFLTNNGTISNNSVLDISLAALNNAWLISNTDPGTIICPTGQGWERTACGSFTWIGTTNTEWAVATNWSGGIAPADGNNIYIPNGAANDLSAGASQIVGDVYVDSASTLNLSSTDFTVNGTFTNYGTVNISNSSTFRNNGTGTNNGTISNGATMDLTSGTFTNNATLSVSGVVNCPTHSGWTGTTCGDYTWIGSSGYSSAAGWAGRVTPDSGDDINIPVTGTDPVIDGGAPSLRNVTVQDGASLTVLNETSISITGTSSILGAFILTDNGSMTNEGYFALHGTLTLEASAGTLTNNGTLDFTDGTLAISGTLTNNGTILCPVGQVWNGTTCALPSFIWHGNVNNQWNNAANWNENAVPTAGANIYIPDSVANSPVITTIVSVNNLVIGVGSSVTIGASGVLTNADTIIINGSLINGVSSSLINSGTIDNYNTFDLQNGTYSGGTYVDSGGAVYCPYGQLFNGNICETPVYTWTGALGSDWENGGSWDLGSVPIEGAIVIINTTVSDPVISSYVELNSLTIHNGASVYVQNENTLDVDDTVIDNGGTLILQTAGSLISNSTFGNHGTVTITNGSFYSGGETENSGGTFTNTSGGVEIAEGGTFDYGGGTVTNNATFVNFGTLTGGAGSGSFDNNGTIENHGDIQEPFSFTNAGTLVNWEGADIEFSATNFDNVGTIENNGTITNAVEFVSHGTFTNGATGTLTNNTTFDIASSSTFTNAGIIQNNWEMNDNNATFLNSAGGTVTNAVNGTFNLYFAFLDNFGTFTNNGEASMDTDSTFTNEESGELINTGIFTQFGTFNFLLGSLTNTGSISHDGPINCATGKMWNGTICGNIQYVWNGSISTHWDLVDNWDNELVPSGPYAITIPNGKPRYPTITGTVTVSNLTIAAGATLTVGDSGTLTSDGTMTNAGSFQVSSGGTFINTGTFTNTGSVGNAGVMNFQAGTLTNSTAFTNTGTINCAVGRSWDGSSCALPVVSSSSSSSSNSVASVPSGGGGGGGTSPGSVNTSGGPSQGSSSGTPSTGASEVERLGDLRKGIVDIPTQEESTSASSANNQYSSATPGSKVMVSGVVVHLPSNPSAPLRPSDVARMLASLNPGTHYAAPTGGTPVTRGAVIAAALKRLGLTPPPAESSFRDTKDSPYANAIAMAEKMKLITGDTDAQGRPIGIFRPNDAMNAKEAQYFLRRAKRFGLVQH